VTELGRVVAEALVAYRRRHRLTQKQLGQLLGWRQSHVSRLERGQLDPQLPTIEQLAERLGLVVELRIVDATPVSRIDRALLEEISPSEERRYIGSERPPPIGELVKVRDRAGLEWPLPHVQAGGSELAWGSGGAGVYDLALSILVDALEEVWTPGRREPSWRAAYGDSLALEMADDFLQEVVKKLPKVAPGTNTEEVWQLRQQDVLAWVDEWKAKQPGIRPKRQ